MKEKETVIFAGNCCMDPSISIPVMPDKPQLAHAYVPYQVYMGILPAMEGFKKGTVFKELYQPYSKKREELWMKSNMPANLPEMSRQLPTKQAEKANTLINEKYIKGTIFPDSYNQ